MCLRSMFFTHTQRSIPVGHAVQPNGAIQEVGVDELFFSVTDGRGVIESSNEVFVRLSRYSRGSS